MEKKRAFDKNFEEKIPQALFLDHAWAEQILEVVDYELFDLVHVKKIVQVFVDYYNKYNKLPSVSLMESIIGELDDVLLIKKCYDFFDKMKKNPLNGDLDYVKDKSLEYFRLQTVAKTLNDEILPRIETGQNLEDIVSIFQKAVSKGTSRDIGYCYEEDEEKRFAIEEEHKVPSQWPYLNNMLRGGFGAKRLVTFLGPAGSGKSSLLVGCGSGALLSEKVDELGEVSGRTVVHYTLELSDLELAQKYDANITGVNIDDVPKNKMEVLSRLKGRLPKGARLIIKEYPMKSASIQTIRAHLARLKMQNILPDLIIIDYGDLLRTAEGPDGEKRHGLEGIWQDMKRLAQELKVPVVTATQTNRSGYSADIILPDQISEDFSKVMTSDILVTLARPPEAKILGVGKMYLAKNRQGKDGIIYAYSINTSKCSIDMFELTEEIEGQFEEGKKEAERTQTQELKDKLKQHLAQRKSKIEN